MIRDWLRSISALVIFCLMPIASPQVMAGDGVPNIIIFLSDDHRSDQMGCAGHPILQTPTMDRLAAAGLRFENMFVTTSICAASRATIFTGLYERSHRYTFRTVPLSADATGASYPSQLRLAGYHTGFIGKFGVAVESGERQKMFDEFRPLNRSPYFKEQPDGSQRHITQIAADYAIEYLDARDESQPFCLSISYNAPHAEDNDKQNHYPWPKVVDGLYDDVEIPEPALSDAQVFASQPEFLKAGLNRQRWYWRWDTPEKYQRNMRAYYRLLSGVDHSMGRVLDHLASTGLDKNTIVIFTGDNGYYMGSRGFAGKWSHYEESLRVPLIVVDPRVATERSGTVVDPLVLNIDLAATILDYAGIQPPSSYQGRSLKPWVSGDEPDSWRSEFFIEHLMHYPEGIPKYEGVRGQRYVYARYFEQQPVFEFLHDLQSDPQQLENLALNDQHKDLLEEMRVRCDALRDANGGEYSLEKFPLARPNR